MTEYFMTEWNRVRTNAELIKKLQDYPDDARVNLEVRTVQEANTKRVSIQIHELETEV